MSNMTTFIDETPPAGLPVDQALTGAHAALARYRASAAELISMPDHERRLVAGVEGVVDHVRRVMLPTASPHYQADKAGPLVLAALSVQAAAFDGYAGDAALAWGDAPDEDELLDRLAGVAAAVEAAVEASAAVRWDVARTGCPSEGSVEALRQATRGLVALVSDLTKVAQPVEGF